MQSSVELIKNQDEVTLAYALLQSSIESLKNILIFSIDKNYHYLHFNNVTGHAYLGI
jgi:hypothetical protein